MMGLLRLLKLLRRARVSSKTKDSKKVFTQYLEREALLNNRCSELTWRTDGGIRIAKQDEIGKSPHGSFTKVDIVELKMKVLDMFQLQCKLKDIYFPYIQCDEVSNTGKTSRLIEFQVNGVDLAEIEGGEVAIANLHSCNGPEFIFQLHLSFTQENGASLEANARLRCVYFPIVEVDNKGCIDLSGILELTAGYGKIASISVLFKEEVIFEQEFQTEKRELRIASEMPEFCIAGSQLDNIIFEIVNSEGHVDETIHDDERLGHFHMLKIKSDSFNAEDSLRYTFKHGRCTVPSIFLPKNEGSFCLVATHSRHQELQLTVKIPILRGPKVEYENTKSPVSEAKSLVIQDSLDHAGYLTPSIVRTPKGFDDIYRYGLQIVDCEK